MMALAEFNTNIKTGAARVIAILQDSEGSLNTKYRSHVMCTFSLTILYSCNMSNMDKVTGGYG